MCHLWGLLPAFSHGEVKFPIFTAHTQRRWTLTLVFRHPPSEVSQRERVPPSGRVLYSSTPVKPSNQDQTNKRACLPWSKVQSIEAVTLTFVSSQTVVPGTALLLLCFCSCECDKLVYMLPRCPEPCELVFLPTVLQPFWHQNEWHHANRLEFFPVAKVHSVYADLKMSLESELTSSWCGKLCRFSICRELSLYLIIYFIYLTIPLQ